MTNGFYSRLDETWGSGQTPDAYAAQFTGQRGHGAALTTGSAPWPLATEQTEEFNRQTLVTTG